MARRDLSRILETLPATHEHHTALTAFSAALAILTDSNFLSSALPVIDLLLGQLEHESCQDLQQRLLNLQSSGALQSLFDEATALDPRFKHAACVTPATWTVIRAQMANVITEQQQSPWDAFGDDVVPMTADEELARFKKACGRLCRTPLLS